MAAMKIVIQNVESQGYLAASGAWTGNAGEAEDFEAILRAYKFARDHTSGHFQIVLYCAEDNYIKNIIDGMGLVAPPPQSPAGGVQMPGPLAGRERGIKTGRFALSFLRHISRRSRAIRRHGSR